MSCCSLRSGRRMKVDVPQLHSYFRLFISGLLHFNDIVLSKRAEYLTKNLSFKNVIFKSLHPSILHFSSFKTRKELRVEKFLLGQIGKPVLENAA